MSEVQSDSDDIRSIVGVGKDGRLAVTAHSDTKAVSEGVDVTFCTAWAFPLCFFVFLRFSSFY